MLMTNYYGLKWQHIVIAIYYTTHRGVKLYYRVILLYQMPVVIFTLASMRKLYLVV